MKVKVKISQVILEFTKDESAQLKKAQSLITVLRKQSWNVTRTLTKIGMDKINTKKIRCC